MSKYICVFCDERKESDTAHLINGKIGICRHCFENLDKTAYASPYQGTEHIAFTMSPFEYTKSMRKVILDLKFSNCKAYAKLLADMMKNYLDSYDIWDTFDYIVPVPLHKKRLKERGYNQSELIAKEVAEYLKIPMRTDLLIRTKATKKQSSLVRTERVTNVQSAFKCTEKCDGKKILLFDIYTTGNTAQSCARELANNGAEQICALTLAIHVQIKLPIIAY
jgi:competence protein ComFC